MKAHEKAKRLARADRTRYRFRAFADLLFMCLRSRLATAIHKRRVDWQLQDAQRWLVRLGLTPEESQSVVDEALRRRIRANRLEGGNEIILPPRGRNPKKQQEPGN
jgi:hypothetical protein